MLRRSHFMTPIVFAASTATLLIAVSGCFDSATDPSVSTPSNDDAGVQLVQPALYGCYAGPNDIFPVGTCEGTQFFDPGTNYSTANVCGIAPIAFTAVSDLTLTTSINQGLFTAYCGDFTRRSVRSFQFTVSQYIALRNTTPPNFTGDYTIDTSFVTNGQQVYWWQNPLINGSTAGVPGVEVRLIGEDSIAGIPYPLFNGSPIDFSVLIIGPPFGSCASAKGWLQFHKTCMDAAIIGLPGNTVLFEISVLKC